jgi:hypothetical protein
MFCVLWRTHLPVVLSLLLQHAVVARSSLSRTRWVCVWCVQEAEEKKSNWNKFVFLTSVLPRACCTPTYRRDERNFRKLNPYAANKVSESLPRRWILNLWDVTWKIFYRFRVRECWLIDNILYVICMNVSDLSHSRMPVSSFSWPLAVDVRLKAKLKLRPSAMLWFTGSKNIYLFVFFEGLSPYIISGLTLMTSLLLSLYARNAKVKMCEP